MVENYFFKVKKEKHYCNRFIKTIQILHISSLNDLTRRVTRDNVVTIRRAARRMHIITLRRDGEDRTALGQLNNERY